MSIRSLVNDFLDKSTDARFRRDSEGRLVFFPMGFGSGRIVPNATVEAALRVGCRRLLIAILAIIIPIVAAISAFYPFMGLWFLLFFVGCLALGFASQLYPLWLSRGLAPSNERLSYIGAMSGSLDRFGRKFLIFGLATSANFTVATGLSLLYQPIRAEIDPVAAALSFLIFAPMTVLYAMALRRNRTMAAASK